MVQYMDHLVGQLVDGITELGMRDDTLILFYSDNGTDRKIHSRFQGQEVPGGKSTTAQTGIRVPLVANWPGKIRPSINSDLIEASDFFPTLAELAGNPITEAWPHTDGVSFAPQLSGNTGTLCDWAFFWYDPRPGWAKDKFERSIFELDHRYKWFSDQRLYDIKGEGLREVPPRFGRAYSRGTSGTYEAGARDCQDDAASTIGGSTRRS